VNLYTYVGNNPLRYRDPLGLDKVSATCRYLDCVGECVTGQFTQNLSAFGRCLAVGVPSAAAVGVAACVAIVVSEPYLLPAFQVCAGLAATSTAAVMASVCFFRFNVEDILTPPLCLIACS